MRNAQQTIHGLLALADVEIGGGRDFDLQVNDPVFYQRVLSGGALGFGEAYMLGLWDCPRIDKLIDRLLRADLEHAIPNTINVAADMAGTERQ